MSGEWKVLSVATTIAYALVYTAGYLVLTLYTLGAGHGTATLLSALPTWLIFLACVVMMFWAERKQVRVAILILMFFSYVVTSAILVIMLVGDEFGYAVKYFNRQPEMLLASVGWYLAGQGIFWWIFAAKRTQTLP